MTAHDVVAKFFRPLVGQFRLDVGDEAAFRAALERELGGATEYQLTQAAERIVRTRKHRTFPSVAECIDAVVTSPLRPPESIEPAPKGTFTPSRYPPVVMAAQRYIDAWERADERGRAGLERGREGHILRCRHVVDVWSRPDDGRKSATDEERARQLARVYG